MLMDTFYFIVDGIFSNLLAPVLELILLCRAHCTYGTRRSLQVLPSNPNLRTYSHNVLDIP